MHPVIALAVGMVVAWAVMPRGSHDPLDGRLGWRRLAAGAAGALYPYLDVILHLLGPGAYLQLGDGLTWALPLVPFHAMVVAVALSLLTLRRFAMLYIPVLAAMSATVLLALLTDDGIMPFAMLWDGRAGLDVLYSFDALILGLATLTLVVGAIFFPLRVYVAWMGLATICLYILSTAGFAWQARGVGYDYAERQGLEDVYVKALPQPLSPLNWRVIVADNKGFFHDTLVNLKRTQVMQLPPSGATRAARIDALYRPVRWAVWRVYDRFGRAGEDTPGERLRAERAWDAWQETAFAWYGRYAVFDGVSERTMSGRQVTCVGFIDLRYDGARDADRGRYVICPGRTGRARVFRPNGDAMTELTPLMSVTNVGGNR